MTTSILTFILAWCW